MLQYIVTAMLRSGARALIREIRRGRRRNDYDEDLESLAAQLERFRIGELTRELSNVGLSTQGVADGYSLSVAYRSGFVEDPVAYAAVRAAVRRAQGYTMTVIRREYQRALRAQSPVVTGRMRRSIRVKRQGRAGVDARVVVSAPGAPYVFAYNATHNDFIGRVRDDILDSGRIRDVFVQAFTRFLYEEAARRGIGL